MEFLFGSGGSDRQGGRQHPLVRFVDGPVGRRARLVGTGKDIWEDEAVVRDNDGLVQAAVTYCGAYPREIDEWVALNEQEAAESHGAWLAGQAALKR